MSDAEPSTEANDGATREIDRLGTRERVLMLVDVHAAAVAAVRSAQDTLAQAVEMVVAALRSGRRVVVLGAGTSGRLAVLDASELPPTFGFEAQRYEGRIAGGDAALRRAIEGVEDDTSAGVAAIADLVAGDVLVAVSASGGAPFVIAAVRAARSRGVRTVAIVNAEHSILAGAAELAVEAPTGPEAIAGSTRLRAGTAQKIALNTISTAAMIALGKTYGNRMVDVVATNAKLRARAERLVREIGAADDPAATLAAAGQQVKRAIVMSRRNVDAATAQRLLDAAGGHLTRVIDDA